MRAKRPRSVQADAGPIWTPAQLARFLEYAKGHRLSAFYYLTAFVGARRGELLNLSWSDVEASGALVITGSASVVERHRIVGTTKGGRVAGRASIRPLSAYCRRTERVRLKKGF